MIQDPAAKVINEAGLFAAGEDRTNPTKTLIGLGKRDEFDGMIGQALEAADAARTHAQSEIFKLRPP
jgi:hypothetical protein